ncbi:MAG: cobalamin-independent methionine synthase II family protein [Candidatus Gottesmanbacteria bacterium]|nr:cobalamin-independent methionine synthase II family protein [Candidatus Gottesmanbacteria bacterium]
MNTNKFRADVVGSMLRPKFLLDAQERLKKGKITNAELTLAEDKAVKEAVAIQEKIGMDVVTDGEMRRPVFCHNFVKACDGFAWNVPGNTVIWFDMKGNKIIDPVTVGVVKRIEKKHDISVDEFSFLRGITDKPIKVTIPSPTMMSYYFVPGISNKVHPSPIGFLHEVTRILKESVDELERIGVTHIQVDAPDFGMLLDPVQQEWFAHKGFEPETLIHEGVEMINVVLSGFSGTKALHICRGNDKNRFMAKGGYEQISRVVFKKARVDRLLLEFDSERAGDFSPLRHVPKDKMVVLGLITTKSPVLEEPQVIIRRIKEASQFIPIERLALSTQCGFASVAKGNNMTFQDQEKKLRLVVHVARRVWKDK